MTENEIKMAQVNADDAIKEKIQEYRQRNLNVTPFRDDVIVKRVELDSYAGIVIVQTDASDRSNLGVVMAVGPGSYSHVTGVPLEHNLKVGDVIRFKGFRDYDMLSLTDANTGTKDKYIHLKFVDVFLKYNDIDNISIIN